MSRHSSKLLVTDPLKPDEGLTGYILRLAERNGYEESGWILALAGFGSYYGQ